MELSFSPRNFDASQFGEYAKDVHDIYNNHYNYGIDTSLRRVCLELSISDACVREAMDNASSGIAIPENRSDYKAAREIMLNNRQQGVKSQIANKDSLLKVLKTEWKQRDSLNLLTLINIVKTKGWPGINLVGSFNSKEGEPCPRIMVRHSANEELYQWFSQYIEQACLKGNEDWRQLIRLQTGYFVYPSFWHGDNIKLTQIYLKNNRTIDGESSLLHLCGIAEWLRDNPKLHYEFNVSEAVLPEHRSKLLQQLKKMLLEQGINPSQISFGNEVVAIDTSPPRAKQFAIDLPAAPIQVKTDYYFVAKEMK
jgi:hypothetical protein